MRNMPPHSLEDPMAWVVCAICALLGVLAYGFESSVLSWGLTPRQVGTWHSMALLVGLWMVPSLPPLFAVLLALLVMSLFDLALEHFLKSTDFSLISEEASPKTL